MKKKLLAGVVFIVCASILGACNKGGSGIGPSDTSLVMSISPSSVNVGGTATINWFSRADTCSASGDWSGQKSAAGTQNVGPFMTEGVRTFSLSCNNGATSAASLLVGTPADDPNTKTSPDGLVTITIVQRTPATGPLVPGQPQFLKLHVTNRSDYPVFVSIDVFGGGPIFAAHSESDSTQGNSHGGLSGSVPTIHVKGSYDMRNQTTAWTMEFIGWP